MDTLTAVFLAVLCGVSALVVLFGLMRAAATSDAEARRIAGVEPKQPTSAPMKGREW
jgi:hypothetical protein